MSLFLVCAGLARAQANEHQPWTRPLIADGYGVQVKEGRTTDRELDKIKEAGLSYVRFVIPWYEVEKERGVFDWGYFDGFVKRLRKRGLKAVIVIGAGHPLYTEKVKAPEGNMDQTDYYLLAPVGKEQVAAFANYAAETVSHFGAKDILWEIWNEPDSDRFWAPAANVDHYIAVATAACRAMKEAEPAAKVIGPGMADMPGRWRPWPKEFLSEVLRSPLLPCLDALSLHPYRDGDVPPETVLDAHDKLRLYIEKNTPSGQRILPVVSSEWGFPTTHVNPEEQAAFAIRSFLLNSFKGVPVSIWYEWRDARSGEDDPEAHFGLLKLNGEEKPAYQALKSFLVPLKGYWIETRLTLGNEKDFFFLLKDGKGGEALVAWTLHEEGETKLLLKDEKGEIVRSVTLSGMPTRLDLQDLGSRPAKLSLVREKG